MTEKDILDITLIVEGIPFQVNKEVLMGESQYFRAMFSNHFAEKNKSVIHIQVSIYIHLPLLTS